MAERKAYSSVDSKVGWWAALSAVERVERMAGSMAEQKVARKVAKKAA